MGKNKLKVTHLSFIYEIFFYFIICKGKWYINTQISTWSFSFPSSFEMFAVTLLSHWQSGVMQGLVYPHCGRVPPHAGFPDSELCDDVQRPCSWRLLWHLWSYTSSLTPPKQAKQHGRPFSQSVGINCWLCVNACEQGGWWKTVGHVHFFFPLLWVFFFFHFHKM